MGHDPESSAMPRPRPRRRTPRIDSLVVGLCVTLAAGLTVASVLGHEVLPGGRGQPMYTPDAAPAVLPIEDRPVWFDGPASEALGTEALALIAYDWPTRLPGWRIEFVTGDSPVAGYTWSREQRIEVFVRPGADGADLARILAHELGHAVDVTHNRPEDRTEWLRLRGLASDTPWWPDSGAADFRTGAGDFAEVFAAWQIGPGDFRSELAPIPSAAVLEQIAGLADRS